MKKSLATIALAGLVAIGLAGCSSGPSSNASGGSKSTPLVVLTYAQGPQITMYQKFFDRCKKSTGYTFKQLQVPASSMVNKAIQLTASGNGPAMIVADNEMVAALANAQALTPITMGTLKASDFVQGPLKAGEFKGKRYGIPVGNNGEVIAYNKALLSTGKLPVPTSWAQLSSNAKALTSGKRYGFGQTFQAGETLSWNYWAQVWSAGGSIAKLDSPAAVEAAQFWASFVKDGTAPKASLQWQSNNVESQLAAGDLAMGQLGTWELSALLADAKKSNVEVGITAQVSKTGATPIVPFGGEELTAGSSVSGAALKAVNSCIVSWSTDVSGLATRDEFLGYLPSYIPAQAAVLKVDPYLQVLANMLQHSRGRTEEVGPNYQPYSVAVSTALQQIATGAATPQAAMTTAQQSASSKSN